MKFGVRVIVYRVLPSIILRVTMEVNSRWSSGLFFDEVSRISFSDGAFIRLEPFWRLLLESYLHPSPSIFGTSEAHT